MAASEHQYLVRYGRAVWRRIEIIAFAQMLRSLAVISMHRLCRDPDCGPESFLLTMKILALPSLPDGLHSFRHRRRIPRLAPCVARCVSRDRNVHQSASPFLPARRIVTYVQ